MRVSFKIKTLILLLINNLNSLIAEKILNECPKPYSQCYTGNDGFINLHIVPHTHDDVGWLKTVDQYYYGSNTKEQFAGVQYILDTVVDELLKDSAKRFVYVEIAFFYRWWNEQNNKTKESVRLLVNDRRLEFVIGAWCMNDEATTYYSDIIDQQSLGLKFILKEFGECARPRTAWQLDPFGHSREQASLFAQFGFDGLFHGRIDYQDFDLRGQTKTREFLWQASQNLGQASEMFTGILPNRYIPPAGFCFDATCLDDPIMDDHSLEDYNVDEKVNDFIEYIMTEYEQYNTDSLIMTMGRDFQYSNALQWYKNLDKLIYYVNQRQFTNNSKINVFYSTPSCYLYALNQANKTWTIKNDDFFPYASKPHTFWTGYFTSRPSLKYFVRQASNFLKASKKYSFFYQLTQDPLEQLQRALSVVQHHDGVSGTEKQHVANDYAKRLSLGINSAMSIVSKLEPDYDFIICSFNISECIPIENKFIIFTLIYNSNLSKMKTWFRFPVEFNDYYIANENFELLQSEIIEIDNQTLNIPERKNSKALYNLVFQAEAQPLDAFIGFISRNSMKSQLVSKQTKTNNEVFTIENKYLQLKFDNNGNLIQLENLKSGINTNLKQFYCFYKSMVGNNSIPDNQSSGAYIFRPENESSCYFNVTSYTIYKGELFSEVRQVYTNWISQTVRLYKNVENIEFEWQIGPIPIDDEIGKEVIIKFISDINSNETFYTDSNGREILKRIRDFRPTWKLNQSERISGNYYPINSRIYIKDEQENKQLTIVTDRSQGGSSIQDGSIEIMLHRRLLHDDSLGVVEPLNETGSDGQGLIVKGKIYVIFDKIENSARLHRPLAIQLNNQPLALFNGTDNNLFEKINFKTARNNRNSTFPDNLHLLTFEREYDRETVNSSCLLIRLEHFYELEEDSEFSQPIQFDLQLLIDLIKTFVSVDFQSIEELALGANMNVNNLDERLKWNSQTNENPNYNYLNTSLIIEFQPMQIRTFRILLHKIK